MLTSTTTGPEGETRELHQYSPGLSGPVAFPVGMPLVWNDGCGIGAVDADCRLSVVNAIAVNTMSFDFILRLRSVGTRLRPRRSLFRERVGSLEIAAEREVQIHAFAQAGSANFGVLNFGREVFAAQAQ